MTVASTIMRTMTIGNGVTTAFPVTFPFHSQSDLVVKSVVILTGDETIETLNSGYTISGTPDALGLYTSGGTVNMAVAPPSTVRLVIYRDPARTQSLDLQDASSFPADSLEAQIDKNVMMIQRLYDIILRCIRAPDGDSFVSGFLNNMPDYIERANKFLAFSATGHPIAAAGTSADLGPVTAFVNTLLDDADAATFRTTLGAVGLTGNETVAGVKTFSSNPIVSGGGVQFPATQAASSDANCLDDYEEGTWTPSLGGTATYTSRAGTYTKIGRWVHITCRIVVNSIGSGSASTITGLPFASSASNLSLGPARWASGANNVTTLNAYIGAATSSVVMVGIAAAGASDTTVSIFGNSTDVIFSASYIV